MLLEVKAGDNRIIVIIIIIIVNIIIIIIVVFVHGATKIVL